MVVCNMLNFTWAVARSNSADAPKETTPIRLDDFSCTGSERSLSECPHYFVGESDCSLGRIAEIGCMPAWRVRLAGADDSSRRGRVEIADERKQWGSLCDTMFDKNAAKVVCKMLGYQTSSSHYDVGAVDDEGAFVIDVLKCMGTEDSLQSCRYIAKESCDKKSVITVECL
ncbi:neurotrypsin-like [Mercenaria mercenaria]|uniref:neurotrypsin-like n=1 Tax=Mercenaria mercenaria TaxID=6596 RepID=UPI00234F85A6|nr:neurotrypsin-like [Mercenaria mercenaria]XP_053374849.1 neurotrypsin-like [Mercenaria mercenaria]